MKISIVTISYNQGKFIESTILSVLEQDYKNIEYIIVDAGSTDDSRTIISKYKNSIKKIVFESDNGPADGLNKGFSNATGDIFYYLNADDILLPGALSFIVDIFINSPDLDVVYGNGVLFDQNGRVLKNLYASNWNFRSYIYGTVSVIQQATFIRKEAFISINGFNTNNKTCWDFELLARLGYKDFNIMKVNKILGGFRIYNTSLTGSGMYKSKIASDIYRIKSELLGNNYLWINPYIFIYLRLLKNLTEPHIILLKIYDYFKLTFKK